MLNLIIVIIGFYLDNTSCLEKATGLETGVIPDNNITASSYIESSPPSSARLGSHVGWCPLNSINAFLQVDLGVAYYVCAVATQGHSDGNFSYVTHYAIKLSLNGTHWTEYEQVEVYYQNTVYIYYAYTSALFKAGLNLNAIFPRLNMG